MSTHNNIHFYDQIRNIFLNGCFVRYQRSSEKSFVGFKNDLESAMINEPLMFESPYSKL